MTITLTISRVDPKDAPAIEQHLETLAALLRATVGCDARLWTGGSPFTPWCDNHEAARRIPGVIVMECPGCVNDRLIMEARHAKD